MAVKLPETVGATVGAELVGVTTRTLQHWVKDGADIKARRSGHYKLKPLIAYAINRNSGDPAAQRKAESEQENRDLTIKLKAEELRKKRDEVMDRSVVEISKQQYVAGIVKRHVAWRPRMKRQFPDIEKAVLDYCDDELAAIRESCQTFRIDETEEPEE